MKTPYPLAETVLINGEDHLQIHRLPENLVFNEECALITDRRIRAEVIFRSQREDLSCYEVRGTKTPGGDFLLMFPYGTHYGWDERIKCNTMLALRSHDGGKTWDQPSVGLDIDYNQHGFVPLVPRGSSRIYCFGTQPVPGKWKAEAGLRENAPIGYFYSDDDGYTWTGPTLIEPEEDPGYAGMAAMRMCETDDGTWLIGTHNAYYWKEAGIQGKPFEISTYLYVLRSEDQGKTWHILPGKRDEGFQLKELQRMDEGRVINLGGGEVMMLCRTPEGHLWRTASHDDGRTWEAPGPTSLVHPDAPPMVFMLSDGKTLACFHHNRFHNHHYGGFDVSQEITSGDRNEIWVSFSQDGGVTWTEPRFLFANAARPAFGSAFQKFQCSYLDMIEDGGTLHLFVPHLWHEILHLEISEADLKTAPTREQLFG